MDSGELITGVQALPACGVTLSVEERAIMQGSLAVLKSTSKLQRAVFWGKIIGLTGSYYLAKGFPEESSIAKRTFYWSKDGIEWIQLADLDRETFEQCLKISGRFTGDPAHTYVVEVPVPPPPEKKPATPPQSQPADGAAADPAAAAAAADGQAAPAATADGAVAAASTSDAPAGVPSITVAEVSGSITLAVPTVAVVAPDSEDSATEDDEEEGGSSTDEDESIGPNGVRMRKVNIVEEKRLTAVATLIDDMVAIVPRGAFLLTAEHAVVPNLSFGGLSFTDATKVGSFCHLRKPRTFEKRTLLDKSGLAKTVDFLDVLSDDVPAGMWSVTSDPASRVVVVKSLLWPGALAYHLPGTPHHGHCYIGTGEKNLNLAFML